MGGDHAPAEIVRGAVRFLREGGREADGVQALLVGNPEAIAQELTACGAAEGDDLAIVPASQVIEMHEHPLEAVRRKPDASLVVCAQMVRSGQASATLSAGNTGAAMVAAIQILERLPGVDRRPAIATMLPCGSGGLTLLVDSGANVDCTPQQLVQFALLGSIYAEKVLGIAEPRVGLLSNGEEESKGDRLTRETLPLLKESSVRFLGPVEGNHLFEGRVDVAVCDGFVGNTVLKAVEGMGHFALSLIRGEITNPTALFRIAQRLDYAEYGGAPLLGVNGVSLIAHGRSDAKAIASGLRQAARTARADYVGAVTRALAERGSV